jgi:hypothetical protein
MFLAPTSDEKPSIARAFRRFAIAQWILFLNKQPWDALLLFGLKWLFRCFPERFAKTIRRWPGKGQLLGTLRVPCKT